MSGVFMGVSGVRGRTRDRRDGSAVATAARNSPFFRALGEIDATCVAGPTASSVKAGAGTALTRWGKSRQRCEGRVARRCGRSAGAGFEMDARDARVPNPEPSMKRTLSLTRIVVRALARTRRALGRLRRRPVDVAAALTLTGFIACAGDGASDDARDLRAPPQRQEHAQLALDVATRILQDVPALRAFSFEVDGFHALKDNPSKQRDARLVCHALDDDLTQCVIFDGDDEDARLVGVEYVISARAFHKLTPTEQALWHPHNYEVLSGALTAPGLPSPLENLVLARWVNSWGKTWQLWDTGALGHRRDALPLGEPQLAWSFNADGEMNPQLLANREQRLGTDAGERRERRHGFVKEARPQRGVDALAEWFPLRRPIDGVRPDTPPASRLVDAWGTTRSTSQQQQQRQQ
jgi:hypothetical protein